MGRLLLLFLDFVLFLFFLLLARLWDCKLRVDWMAMVRIASTGLRSRVSERAHSEGLVQEVQLPCLEVEAFFPAGRERPGV